MKNSFSKIETVLGFDYGQKYIGIAAGQMITQTSTGVTCLNYTQKMPWDNIQEIITRYNPDAIIVGLPLGERNRILSSTPKAMQFAWQLESRFSKPVYCINEHLSTWEARQQLHGHKTQNIPKKSDFLALNTQAAMILVQRALTELFIP